MIGENRKISKIEDKGSQSFSNISSQYENTSENNIKINNIEPVQTVPAKKKSC